MKDALFSIDGDEELRRAEVVRRAHRLRLLVRLRDPADPLPVDSSPPAVADHAHAMHIRKVKIFWIFMEASIRMWINKWLHLSLTVYDSLRSVANFKVDMHNVYIRAWKDPE